MRSDRIIHNTENRFPGELCFPVNDLYHTGLQNVLERRVIPFAMIQEIGGCGPMLRAHFGKINGFSSVTAKKDGNKDGHQMVEVHIG